MKYYLVNDNSVQWFSYIITIENDKVTEYFKLDLGINGPYLKSICSRELHFQNKELKINFAYDTYYGWTISKEEYDHIKKLIELYPQYLEYIKNV